MNDSSWSNATWIWVNNVAYPLTDYTDHRGKRNNFNIAAANEWLSPQMRDMGIEIFDLFSMTVDRNTDTVCHNHYLCREDDDTPPVGEVGWSAFHSLLSQICHREGILL